MRRKLSGNIPLLAEEGRDATSIKRCEATLYWSGRGGQFGETRQIAPTWPLLRLRAIGARASRLLIEHASSIEASPYRARAPRPPLRGGERSRSKRKRF